MEPSSSTRTGVELTTQCQLWLLDDVRHLLSESNLCLLRNSMFGIFFDIGEIKFQGELINLLCKRLHSSSLDRKSLVFNFAGFSVEFGAADFCLMSGLKFGDKLSLPTHSKFHGLVFPGESNLAFVDIQNAFRKECLSTGGKSVRSLKLAYLIIVHGLLLMDHSGGRIELGYMHLLDYDKQFEEFPWGVVAYEHLVTCIHRLKRELASLDVAQRIHSTEAYGFVYALQCWAYEVIPALGIFCASLNLDKLGAFPRIVRWSVTKNLNSSEDGLCKFFLADHGSDPVRLVLTCGEMKKLADLGINSSMSLASPIQLIDLTKRVGRKLDFDCDEKDASKNKKRAYMRKSAAPCVSPQPTKASKNDDTANSSGARGGRSRKSVQKRMSSKTSGNASTSKMNPITPQSGNLSSESNNNEVMCTLVWLNSEMKSLEERMVAKFNILQHMIENLSSLKCCTCSIPLDNVYGVKNVCEVSGDVLVNERCYVNNVVKGEGSTKGGVYTTGFGTRSSENNRPEHQVYDPNVIDLGSPELDAYKMWVDTCSNSIGKNLVSLPTEILKYADEEWFNDLWMPDRWLESTHIDALTNLLILEYEKDCRTTKPRKWTCMEICCWQVLREANVDVFSPVVLPYVRGEKPLSGGVSWVDASHVFGVANINNNHWILYVVSLNDQLVTVYNSLKQSWDCILHHFELFRKNIATLCAIGGIWERSSGQRAPLKSTWDIIEHPNPPRQSNLNDCGIMVIKYMECLAYNVPVWSINPKVCANSRQRYCGKLYKLSREVKEEPL